MISVVIGTPQPTSLPRGFECVPLYSTVNPTRHALYYIQSRSSLDFLCSSKASLMTSHKSLQRNCCSSVRSCGSLSGCKKNRIFRTVFLSLVSSRPPVGDAMSQTETGFQPRKYSWASIPKVGGNTWWMLQSSWSTDRRICIAGGWRPHLSRTLLLSADSENSSLFVCCGCAAADCWGCWGGVGVGCFVKRGVDLSWGGCICGCGGSWCIVCGRG
mmetsp:Transcript_5670/g.16250  ORF Transcript_5670/g.16250 Transcript_5670/m.16250 type:complete len:215 (-) Transcript_5670:286-930(-)